MKSLLALLLIVPFSCVFIGCPAKHHWEKETFFISKYFEPTLFVSQIEGADTLFVVKYKVGNKDMKGEEWSKYKSLCVKHNDLGLSKPYKYSYEYGAKVVAWDFEKVEIKCLSDYDKEHLKGSSLNDITTFYTTTLYPFLKSGYEKLADPKSFGIPETILKLLYPAQWLHSPDFKFSLSSFFPNIPVVRRTSELKKDDLMVIGGGYPNTVPHLAVIRLDKRPEKTGDYMIDVIFTTDEGGTIAAGGIVHFD